MSLQPRFISFRTCSFSSVSGFKQDADLGSQVFSFHTIPPLQSVNLKTVYSSVISQLHRNCFSVHIFVSWAACKISDNFICTFILSISFLLSMFPLPICIRPPRSFCLFVCVLKVYGQISEIKVSHWRRKGLRKLHGGGRAHGSGTFFATYRITNLFLGSSGLDATLYDEGNILRDLGLILIRITDSLRNVYSRRGGWFCPTGYIRHRCLHYVLLYTQKLWFENYFTTMF
jgi:hypothetical protein